MSQSAEWIAKERSQHVDGRKVIVVMFCVFSQLARTCRSIAQVQSAKGGVAAENGFSILS